MTRRLLPGLALVLFAACQDAPTDGGTNAPTGNPVAGTAGLVEVTITGLGSERPTSSARAIPSGETARLGERTGEFANVNQSASMVVRLQVLGGDGTIQLDPVSTSSFTLGSRPGGYRYVNATYRVRNAQSDGTVHIQQSDITLLAVSTGASISGTGLSTLKKFNNTSASSSALAIKPAGAAFLNPTTNVLGSSGPDVLQVYSELDISGITGFPGSGVTALPYGFVVRSTTSSTDRTLHVPASDSDYEGLVTFAYKIPLEASSTDDPFTITATFVAVKDNQKFVTRSLEESDGPSGTAYTARVSALGATGRIISEQGLCGVRTAGTSNLPTAMLSPGTPYVLSRTPLPYSGAASFLAGTGTISTTFCAPVTGAGSSTWIISGSQSGRAYVGNTYTGLGTRTVTTPAGVFKPGEEIEVTLTSGVKNAFSNTAAVQAHTSRYRVAAGAGGGLVEAGTSPFSAVGPPSAAIAVDFSKDLRTDLAWISEDGNHLAFWKSAGAPGDFVISSTFEWTTASDIAGGDVNGDGYADVVVVSRAIGDLGAFLSDGAGGMTVSPAGVYFDLHTPRCLTLTDVNQDGYLDVAYVSNDDSKVYIRLGDGTGAFTEVSNAAISPVAVAIAAADFNQDGKIDLAFANSSDNTVTILQGNGAGAFTPFSGSPFTVGNTPFGIGIGDFNGDGRADFATPNLLSHDVTIMLGDGLGGFTGATGSPYPAGTNPRAVGVADMNGDGKLDLVVANQGTGTLQTFLGIGNGGFNDGGTVVVGAGTLPSSVALGDFDGDGTVDAITGNFGDGGTTTYPSLSIFLNP